MEVLSTLRARSSRWKVAAMKAHTLDQGKKPIKDIPVELTVSPVQEDPHTGTFPGWYGETNANPVLYKDGFDGVYIKFAPGNNNSLYLNLQGSTRYVTADFSHSLADGDSSSIGYVHPTVPLRGWLIKINDVANLALYRDVLGSSCEPNSEDCLLDTLMVSNVYLSSGDSISPIYCNNDTASLDCSGARLARANRYSDTSLVRVRVSAGCFSWTVEPVPFSLDPTGSPADPGDPEFNSVVDGHAVAGLIAPNGLKGKLAGNISGGQYHMPFTFTVVRTGSQPVGGWCADLPQ
jgi:hypothetical protein